MVLVQSMCLCPSACLSVCLLPQNLPFNLYLENKSYLSCFLGSCAAFTENVLFENCGIICWSPPPSLLPGQLSMDKRGSNGFFSTRKVHTVSNRYNRTTNLSLIIAHQQISFLALCVCQNCWHSMHAPVWHTCNLVQHTFLWLLNIGRFWFGWSAKPPNLISCQIFQLYGSESRDENVLCQHLRGYLGGTLCILVFYTQFSREKVGGKEVHIYIRLSVGQSCRAMCINLKDSLRGLPMAWSAAQVWNTC